MGWFGAGIVVICWFVLGFCFGVRSRGWWLFMDVCKLLVLVDYRLCGFCFWVCCGWLIAFCCLLLALPVVCVSIAYSADGCVATLRVEGLELRVCLWRDGVVGFRVVGGVWSLSSLVCLGRW